MAKSMGEKNSPTDPNLFRILAFGDSLTAGYFAHGMKFHPYTNRLSNLINTKFGENKCSVGALLQQ